MENEYSGVKVGSSEIKNNEKRLKEDEESKLEREKKLIEKIIEVDRDQEKIREKEEKKINEYYKKIKFLLFGISIVSFIILVVFSVFVGIGYIKFKKKEDY